MGKLRKQKQRKVETCAQSFKVSERTEEQKKIMEKLRKQKQRKLETYDQSFNRKESDRVRKRKQISKETPVEKAGRNSKDRRKEKEKRSNEKEEDKVKRNEKKIIYMKEVRSNETEEDRIIRNEKNREHMTQQRINETEKDRIIINEKNREHMKQQRINETEEDRIIRNEKNREHITQQRMNETKEQKLKRCTKNKMNMRKVRNNSTELTRLNKFKESVKYGPIFTCNVCEQDMFRNNVSVLTEDFKLEVKAKGSELHNSAFERKQRVKILRCTDEHELEPEVKCYICTTCKKHLKKGNLPAMSAANGLRVIPIPDKELQLGQLESNLIAKTIIFPKIYQLPKSRMAACKDRLINIPVSSEDVINTIEHLPRTPKEAGLLEVKLKRKLEYKNTHQQALIDPERIFKALQFLKNSGHPDYQFYDNYDIYERRCKKREKIKTQFIHDVDVEAILEKEQYLKTIKPIPYLTDDEDSDTEDECTDAEDEEYIKKDVVRKFQFDYDTSVCLVDKFPEAAITEESTNIESKEISIAPGEGKTTRCVLSIGQQR